jgi:hypothetical protein
MSRTLRTAGLALALVAPAQAQNLWTVDDNGSADFASVQTAINTVAPGDVLLIKPGAYGPVVVNKSLTLLGDPNLARPTFSSLDFLNIARFDASHLEATILAVTNVSSHALLDDCVLTTFETHFEACADVSVTNCTFSMPTQPVTGLHAVSLGNCGYVQFVNCVLQGGAATAQSSTFSSGTGGQGLILDASTALVIGSNVKGGPGQHLTVPLPVAGKGGDGIRADNASRVEVRGSPADVLVGAVNSVGQSAGQPTGFALRALNGSTAITSGVTATGGFSGPVSQPSARPYLEWSGSGGPGSTRTLQLYGSAGSLGVMFLATNSFLDAGFEPLYGLPLLVHPATIFLSTAGTLLSQSTGIGPTYTLPATQALAGATFYAQAGVLSGSTITSTNAAQLVLSF